MKAGAMNAQLQHSFAAAPVRNVQTSRFRTWLKHRCGLRSLGRCRIALLLKRRGVAARMRNARTDVAEQAFGLEVAHLRVFASSLDIRGGPSVPDFEGVGIMFPHLLLGGKAIGELVEHQVGVDRGHASYQDNEHPFHLADRLSHRANSPLTRRIPCTVVRWPDGCDRLQNRRRKAR